MIPKVDRNPVDGQERQREITVVESGDSGIPAGSKFTANVMYDDGATIKGTPINRATQIEYLAASGTTTGTASVFILAQDEFTLFDGALIRVKFHMDTVAPFRINTGFTGEKPVYDALGNNTVNYKKDTWASFVYSATLDRWIAQGAGTEIVNSLTGTSTTAGLAAAQGPVLAGLIKAAQTAADKGVSDAATAQGRANSAHTLAEGANSTANLKAPISHAVSAITYGVGNNANYGHLRLSDSTSETNNVSGGFAATPLAVANAMNAAIGASAAANNKAPISHAVATTTYGAGNGTNYGHVRLSDLYYNGSAYNVNSGYAATPYAVYKAWEATGSVPPIGYSSTADIEGALSSLSVDESIKAIQGIKIEAPLSDSEKADALNYFDAKHHTTTTGLSCVLALALKGCIKRLDSQQEEINKLKSKIGRR